MSQLWPDQSPDGWNRASAAYDVNMRDLMVPYLDEIVQRAAFGSDLEALDIAAGTGFLTFAIAPRVRRVLAIDFADAMLSLLRARAEREGVRNVETRTMDGQTLDLDDASFDRVCSNFGVNFLPDRRRGFSEIRRVLRPGGRAIMTAWSNPERFQSFGLFVAALQKAIPDLPKPPGTPPVFSLADPEQFASELRSAGFADVRVETVSHEMQLESAEDFWLGASTAAPPTIALLERLGPEKSERVHSTLVEMVQTRFGRGPMQLRNEAHVAVALR